MGHETADPGPRDVDAPFGLLGGTGLTPDAIARNAGTLAAALFHHTLHPAHHRLGHAWIKQGDPTVGSRAGKGISGAQPPGDVGAHQATAIGEHGVQLQQFQRREGEALAEGSHRRFDRLAHEIGLGLQLSGHGAWQVGVGRGIDAKGAHPLPKAIPLDVLHGLDHADVARNLKQGGEINHPIALTVVVEDRPTANRKAAVIDHLAVGINGPLLQGNGQIDRLEGGAGFIEVLHRPLAEEPRLELPEGIGVVGGGGGQGEDFAVAHIHHQGSPALGMPLLHLLDEGLLGHLLQPGIQGELQAQVIAIEGAR